MPNKAQVETKVKKFIEERGLDYNDVVVTGASAVFALAGVQEDHSSLIVVGTTATNYAKLRKAHSETNGYNGLYLDVDGVKVQEGLPLSTETFSRLKCESLKSLSTRLSLTNKPAFEILDRWHKELLEKRLKVKPEMRRNYLTLDEQLEFQDIVECQYKVLDDEEQFALEVSHIDWSHQMSDDIRAWRAGEDHRKRLIDKAIEKFGPGSTLALKFADICSWNYSGYEHMCKLYPWLSAYRTSQTKFYRGMIKAAMDGVDESYVTELREIVAKLDQHFRNLPANQWYGYFVFTDATPPIFKMREAAKDMDSQALYGIAVREDARVGMNATLMEMTREQIEDIAQYGILAKYTESMFRWSLFPSEVFSDNTVLEISGAQGRTYRFMLKL